MTHGIDIDADLYAEVVDIVSGVLELDPADLSWDGDYRDDYDADSLLGIEILSALERRFGITIDPERLTEMVNLGRTYALVVEAQAEAGSGTR
ncbi:acyl carrier protein [Nocardia sp. R16R-3T]